MNLIERLHVYDSIPADQRDAWIGGLSPADFDALTRAVALLPRNQAHASDSASYPGALARGAGQTVVNAVNDFQDGVVGIMNVPILYFNASFWLQEQIGLFDDDAGRLPYYHSPQWSENMFVQETPAAREINKLVGGSLLGAGVAKLTRFLRPLMTRVDDAAGALLGKVDGFAPTQMLDDLADEELVESIRKTFANQGKWGDVDPILVHIDPRDGSRIVIDGHHRLEAARRAGIDVLYRIATPEELLEFGIR